MKVRSEDTKRTPWFDKIRYAHRHTDLFDKMSGILIIAAFVFLCFHLYERFKPIDLLQIDSPVIIDQKEYEINDTIYGKFTGEIYTDMVPEVTRSLVCDNNSYQLVPRKANGGARKLEGIVIAITRLSSEQLEVPGEILAPDTNCFIRFTNTYTIDLPLGGYRIERVVYYSDTFDLVKDDPKNKSDTRPNLLDPSPDLPQLEPADPTQKVETKDPAKTEQPKPEQPQSEEECTLQVAELAKLCL